MTKKLPKRGLLPMHPRELLREEILPAFDRPKTEIARLLGLAQSAEALRSAARRAGARREDQGHSNTGSGMKVGSGTSARL
jgi:hypothetical protein